MSTTVNNPEGFAGWQLEAMRQSAQLLSFITQLMRPHIPAPFNETAFLAEHPAATDLDVVMAQQVAARKRADKQLVVPQPDKARLPLAISRYFLGQPARRFDHQDELIDHRFAPADAAYGKLQTVHTGWVAVGWPGRQQIFNTYLVNQPASPYDGYGLIVEITESTHKRPVSSLILDSAGVHDLRNLIWLGLAEANSAKSVPSARPEAA